MSAFYECECDSFDMTEGQDSFEMNEGIPGPGVPVGGSAGQVLRKSSSEDYDTEWDTLDAGDVAFNKESGYLSGTVGRYLQLLDSEDVQYTYGGEKELGTVGETLDYLADKSVEIVEDVDDLKNTLNRKADVIYDTASGDIASFPDGADGLPVKDLTVAIEPVQDLHGYDNPWPAGSGKNKFNGTFLQGYWAYANGAWVNSSGWIATEKIPCKASTSYTVSADAKLTRWQGFVWYDSNGNFISTDNLNSNVNIGLTKTSPSTAAYLVFNIAGYPGEYNTIVPSDVTHFQLEEGSSSTAYAPYSNICPISGWTGCNISHSGADTSDPTVIPISWQSEAGTVYGGTLDVTTGVLTVTMARYKFTGQESPYAQLSGAVAIKTALTFPTSSKGFCTDFQFNQTGATNFVYLTTPMLAEDVKTYMSNNDVYVVYELATPQTYQLTPTEVTTLLGQNNIWADCGPSTVEYPCDTKLYIQKINTPTDDDMIANANIASGKYFIVNNNLYLSTTAILAGDPIKPGTNCTLTNLAAALNALNS